MPPMPHSPPFAPPRITIIGQAAEWCASLPPSINLRVQAILACTPAGLEPTRAPALPPSDTHAADCTDAAVLSCAVHSEPPMHPMHAGMHAQRLSFAGLR